MGIIYNGEQIKIFSNALGKMQIYDESKTFIVDEAVEQCVTEIKDILRMPSPYGSIPKLPGLIEKFIEAYMAVLNGMAEPIYAAIEEAKSRVFEELEQKSYKDELFGHYTELFRILKEKADTCNNVAIFQNIRIEADALKMRLLSEIAKKDEELAALAASAQTTAAGVAERGAEYVTTPPQPKPPKVKNVSIKNVNTAGIWRVKNKEDIDRRIDELRQRLYSEMEDDTVLNIEF